DPGDTALRTSVDAALTEVLAMSGQVDRAIEMGNTLLARLSSGAEFTAANLHLKIARAAIAGGRWTEAAASIEIARSSPEAELAHVNACAAQVAVGQGHLSEAAELARTALRSAQA